VYQYTRFAGNSNVNTEQPTIKLWISIPYNSLIEDCYFVSLNDFFNVGCKALGFLPRTVNHIVHTGGFNGLFASLKLINHFFHIDGCNGIFACLKFLLTTSFRNINGPLPMILAQNPAE